LRLKKVLQSGSYLKNTPNIWRMIWSRMEKQAPKWSKVLQRGPGQTPFYGFVHFADFQMLAGVQFKVRMGKVSTEVLNCGRETSRVQK
jgi:hypothetical protein